VRQVDDAPVGEDGARRVLRGTPDGVGSRRTGESDIYTYICIHTYVYMYIYVYIYTFLHIYLSISLKVARRVLKGTQKGVGRRQ